jgi:ectoine hydroxylase-related dioxygenase (phytanoyl-CoA dioxygenase family)
VSGADLPHRGVLRLPDDAEVEAFWRDGAVCLRGVLDPDFVLSMAPAVERLLGESLGITMVDLTAMGEELARGGAKLLTEQQGGSGRFISGIDHWRVDADCARFALDSGIGAIAGRLLRSTRVNLWEDSVLVKEPGTRERTAWHQDLAYFHLEGERLCTTWIPLDQVDRRSGAMRFARGSHRWPELFRPNMFVSTLPMAGTLGDEVPDIDAMVAAGRVELLEFALGPGDMSVHHARTLHAAGGNLSADRRRRAISLRYCGDDARYHFRAGAPRKPHHDRVGEGDVPDDPDCPVVWRATAG